jgi:hypothetical protein
MEESRSSAAQRVLIDDVSPSKKVGACPPSDSIAAKSGVTGSVRIRNFPTHGKFLTYPPGHAISGYLYGG